MLTVTSVSFYENVDDLDKDKMQYSGEYNKLHFDEYPITIKIIHLAVHFSAVGDMDVSYFIRIRKDSGKVIAQTAPSLFHLRDRGTGGFAGTYVKLKNIPFSSAGIYFFDIMIDNVSVHSEPLILE